MFANQHTITHSKRLRLWVLLQKRKGIVEVDIKYESTVQIPIF